MNAHNDNDACSRYGLLVLATAEDELTLEEYEFKLQHEDECDVCGTERKVANLFAFDDTSGPADELDDLARRRWIHEVLELTEQAEEKEREQNNGPHRILYVAFAAAATIGVILGGLGVMMLTQGPDVPSVTVVAENYTAQSLLVAGEAHTSAGLLLPGQELKEGDVVRVESGRVALGLPSNISLLLEKGSEIKLEKLNEENFEVALLNGTVLASVDPKAPRPGFAVSTEAGLVTVTGTVFSVRKTSTETDVRVLRGSVRLKEPGRSTRSVKTSQGSILGGKEIFEIDPKEAELLREQKMALEMLNESDDSSALVLKSDPSGATVYIDGATIGSTPLIANVKPGPKRVEIAMAGYRSARQVLDIEPRDTISRTFDLEVVPHKRVRRPARAKKLSAAKLLESASAKRTSRKWKAAAGAYQELLRAHPSSPQAKTARISLADIELDHLRRPEAAIKHYDAYLSGGSKGVVAQEAKYGRIRALRALGRTDRERIEIEKFLAQHPKSMQARILRTRLDTLTK